MLFDMNRYYHWIPGLLVFFVFIGCTHPGRGVKSCNYRFQNLSFISVDAEQSHWKMEIVVTNPNAHEVTLTRMRYALLHESDTLLSGWNPEKRLVPSKDSLVVATSLELPNAVFNRLPSSIWSQKDAKFIVVADAYLNTWVGDIIVPNAIKETIRVDMTAQVAKYRDMLLQKLFSWPNQLNTVPDK